MLVNFFYILLEKVEYGGEQARHYGGKYFG